jgi:hypothetical protein
MHIWIIKEKWKKKINECMEIRLGISLYSSLYFKLEKILCLSYCLLCFLFKNIREEGGTGSHQKQGQEEQGGGPNTVYTCK